MAIVQIVKVLLSGFFTFVAIDCVWIGWLMRNFYVRQLAGSLRMSNGAVTLDVPTALLSWLFLVVGLYYFVVLAVPSARAAWLNGMAYGFLVYGVYNLTNYATLAGWPLTVLVVDTLWGSVISGLVAVVMFGVSG